MQNSFKRILLFVLIFLVSSVLEAGKINRAYEALGIYDYFKAKKLFEKSLKKKVVAAPYGLSIIYSRNDNPFYNLDSAYKYIYTADTSFYKFTSKDKLKLAKLNLDSALIQQQKDKVDSLIFIETKRRNTFIAYQSYIDRHTDSYYLKNAIDSRDSIALAIAINANVPSDYMDFMETYPGSKYYNLAKSKYEKRKFELVVQLNKGRHYREFVAKNPHSPYLREAQDSVYSHYTSLKTIETYSNFIQQNPTNPNVGKAWRNIYKLYTIDYSPERILQFRKEFHDYPFIEELMVDAELAHKELLPFKDGSKWGFMDKEAKIRIEPIYDFVEPFQEGLALVGLNNFIGFIDKKGEVHIPIVYEDGESFNDGLAIISKGEKFGMIDKTNKQRIPIKYEYIGKHMSGLALVSDGTSYGYVNKEGEEKISLTYSNANDFKQSIAIVWQDGKKGMIDSLGKIIIPIQYNWIEPFNSKGLCRALGDSHYGVLNRQGDTVIDFLYNKIGSLDEPLIFLATNKKYRYVNHLGETINKSQYDFIQTTSVWADQWENGYCKFLRKGKYGMIDSTGEEVFPAIFENIGVVTKTDWVAVKKRGKWGYADYELQLKIPYTYEYARSFNDSLAIVYQDNFWGIINKEEEILLAFEFNSITEIEELGFLVEQDRRFGIIDNQLKTVVPAKFKEIKKYNGKWYQLIGENEISYYHIKSKRIVRAIK